mmetsp:Transcript_32975/g.87062  ORF Transcript_32975/g.87062 Transcript_32975/m.87062 type:complete len:81 (+) Transcript_32975:99-341(+)
MQPLRMWEMKYKRVRGTLWHSAAQFGTARQMATSTHVHGHSLNLISIRTRISKPNKSGPISGITGFFNQILFRLGIEFVG